MIRMQSPAVEANRKQQSWFPLAPCAVGPAHELNNPAAAVSRGASVLQEIFRWVAILAAGPNRSHDRRATGFFANLLPRQRTRKHLAQLIH